MRNNLLFRYIQLEEQQPNDNIHFIIGFIAFTNAFVYS